MAYTEVVLREQEKVTLKLPDGREVVIQVVLYKHQAPRLGIKAPRDIPVNREEIHKELQRKKQHGT